MQLAVLERALRDFRLAGVALPPERKARFKAVMSELSLLQAKFEEQVLDATNASSHHVTDAAQLKGINPGIVSRRRRGVPKSRASPAGFSGSISRPTWP